MVVGHERFPTAGRVGAAVGIVLERKETDGRVAATAAVIDERIGSNGRVLVATSIEQKRCRANCGIGISVIDYQRSSADTGVVAAARIRREGIPTKSRIASASGEGLKR